MVARSKTSKTTGLQERLRELEAENAQLRGSESNYGIRLD